MKYHFFWWEGLRAKWLCGLLSKYLFVEKEKSFRSGHDAMLNFFLEERMMWSLIKKNKVLECQTFPSWTQLFWKWDCMQKSLLAGVAEHTGLKSFPGRAELSAIVLQSWILSWMNQSFGPHKIQEDHPERASLRSYHVFYWSISQNVSSGKDIELIQFHIAPKVGRNKREWRVVF